MNRWILAGVLGVGLAGLAGAAERAFSQAIAPADFAAAGLAKLSPEELARLDALVRVHQGGGGGRVPAQVATGPAAAPAAAVAAPEAKAAPGLLAKAKVILTPGTAVEYEAVKSRIVGEFNGWEARTVLVLENGQRWQVASGSTYAAPPVMNPAVEIASGALGTFWMKIEGVRIRVKVVPAGRGN
jgi:hypothetical protein